jgi:hypothetical protein
MDCIGELAGLASVWRHQPEGAVVAEEDWAVLALHQTESKARAVIRGVEGDQFAQCSFRGWPVANGLGGVNIALQLGGEETARVVEAGNGISQRGRLLRHGG